MEQLVTTVRQNSWLEMIRQQKASGLTIKEWCLSNNISENSFYYRQQVLRKNAGKEIAGFVEIQKPVPAQEIREVPADQPSNPDNGAVILAGQVRIELGSNASPGLIESIFRCLHV